MCLAIPLEVIEIPAPGEAIVDQHGVRCRISTALLDSVAVGDLVIVHVGHALARLDENEARETLAAMGLEAQSR